MRQHQHALAPLHMELVAATEASAVLHHNVLARRCNLKPRMIRNQCAVRIAKDTPPLVRGLDTRHQDANVAPVAPETERHLCTSADLEYTASRAVNHVSASVRVCLHPSSNTSATKRTSGFVLRHHPSLLDHSPELACEQYISMRCSEECRGMIRWAEVPVTRCGRHGMWRGNGRTIPCDNRRERIAALTSHHYRTTIPKRFSV